VASSSSRELIDLTLALSGLDAYFAFSVSSEEVEHGKPAPDVYLAAAEGLEAAPRACVAVEDSTNGLIAARAARMRVIAIPNPHFAPTRASLALAARVLSSIEQLDPRVIEGLDGAGAKPSASSPVRNSGASR
jgi:beta-phosphoglucomutase-like phosphatase (HAD superfamily)